MRDYAKELEERVAFIRGIMKEAHADGLVFGNSGGKDSALVGILCAKASENVLSVALPCGSARNFGEDLADARALAADFGIPIKVVDLSGVQREIISAAENGSALTKPAVSNIAPRLRMTALYAIAQSRNSLVVGTGNRSEAYMGYFTKWGDGAYDLDPIADLTVTEIYEFLRYLKAPAHIIEKAPSAGLFEGQTDESEMGVTYAAVDRFLETGEGEPRDLEIINRAHLATEHKRRPARTYPDMG